MDLLKDWSKLKHVFFESVRNTKQASFPHVNALCKIGNVAALVASNLSSTLQADVNRHIKNLHKTDPGILDWLNYKFGSGLSDRQAKISHKIANAEDIEIEATVGGGIE